MTRITPLVLALTFALAACGDDDGEPAATASPTPPATSSDSDAPASADEAAPAETPPAAEAEPEAEAPGEDSMQLGELRTLFGQVKVIEAVKGDGTPHSSLVILYVDDPQGRPHRILVPSDLSLEGDAQRVLRQRSCGGKVDGEFLVEDAPESEELGELILVEADLTAVDC